MTTTTATSTVLLIPGMEHGALRWILDGHYFHGFLYDSTKRTIRNQRSYHQKGKHRLPSVHRSQTLLDGVDIWMGDHLDKIPCAVLIGKSGWRSGHQSRLPPLIQCCMWIEFQSISTWLRQFPPGTQVSSLINNWLLVCSNSIGCRMSSHKFISVWLLSATLFK